MHLFVRYYVGTSSCNYTSNHLNGALLRISLMHLSASADFIHVLKDMLSLVAEALAVSRVCVWLVEENGKQLRSLLLYEREKKRWSSGNVITRKEHPKYFNALLQERLIAISDVENDVRISGFAKTHLKPHHIKSVLYAPLRVSGDLKGVLCYEHTSPREWNREERAFAASAADMVAHLLETRARIAAEEQYRSLVEGAPDAIVAVNEKGQIALFNRAAENLFGYSRQEILGQPLELLVPPEISKDHPVWCAEYRKKPYRWDMGQGLDIFARKKDNSLIPVEISLSPVQSGGETIIIAFVRDASRKRELEKQLMRAQRMEAVGQLAGGVAHDFNNLLTIIMGNADLLLQALDPDHPFYSDIKDISDAAHRAAQITQQLLTFSKRQVMRREVLDLNNILRGLRKIATRLLGEQIQLKFSLAKDLKNIKADPASLEQMLLNLLINAGDAMPEGGTVKISTANAILDRKYTDMHIELEPGEYVMLTVSDTGKGMDPETLEHIFEPFYTTREEGTGLGLAIVYAAVHQMGGGIYVYSEEGKGTTFKIYLPAVKEPSKRPRGRPLEEKEIAAAEKKAVILIVEDDESIRNFIKRAVKKTGHRVRAVESGAQAINIAKKMTTLDIVISDWILKDERGPDVIHAVRQIHPNVQAIITSGYANERISPEKIKDFIFLPKPFTANDLTEAITKALQKKKE